MNEKKNEKNELTQDAVLKIAESYGNDPQQLIAVLLDIHAASGRNYVDRKWAELVSGLMHVPLSNIFDVLTFRRGECDAPMVRILGCPHAGRRECPFSGSVNFQANMV